MKKIIIVLITIITLTGCSENISYINVKKAFPTAKIEQSPYNKYEWIVMTTNANIYFITDSGDGSKGTIKKLFSLTDPKPSIFDSSKIYE